LALALFREFVFTDRMLFGSDTLSLGYMARLFFAEALRGGDFPLWNPLILGGTPFLESVAGGDSLYPTSLLLLLLDPFRALGWKLVLHLPLAGAGMYLWVRSLGPSRQAALLSGLAYSIAPYMVTLVYPGQDGKLFVTALTPFVFWAADQVLRRGGATWVAALALFVGTVILTTHFQMAYFLFGGVGAFAIFRTIQGVRGSAGSDAPGGNTRPRRAGLRFALFLGGAVLGAGVAAVQLVPSFQYVLQDSRRTATTTEAAGQAGVAYSSSWSLHPEEAVSLVVPEFVGSNVGGSAWTTDTYWGRNFFKLNHEYLGVLVLLLAGMAFLGAPQKGLRIFLASLAGVAALFALGATTPVWRVFYEVVPGIRLFRAPSMAIFLTGFAVTTLMGFGLDRGWEMSSSSDPAQRRKLARYLVGWIVGLAVFLLLLASGALLRFWTAILYAGITEAKADALLRATPFIQRGAFLTLLLVGAAGAIFWLRGRRILPEAVAVALLAGLLTLDQGRVNGPFIQTLDYYEWSAPDQHERLLMEEAGRSVEPFRVLSMLRSGQDVRPGMFGIELAAGHHPNDLARYRELIGMEGSGVPRNFFDLEGGSLNGNLLKLLNVRYLLWPDYQFGPLPWEPVSRLTLADGRPYTTVYQVPEVLARAHLVHIVRADGDLETLLSPEFDPGREVILGQPVDPSWGLEIARGSPAGRGGPDEAGGQGQGEGGGSLSDVDVVRWIERGADRMVLEVESPGPALLVVSENWLPGWRATVDGETRPVLRANHTLQAVPLEGGSSRVVLEYRPALVFRSAGISLGSLGLALLLLLVGWFRRRVAVPELQG
jgi:hypothetical protein